MHYRQLWSKFFDFFGIYKWPFCMFHFLQLCFVRIYIQSRRFEWIIDSKAEFSYYTLWQRTENAMRSGGLLLALGSGKMSLLPSLLSLAVLGPCTWYYPVPAHDITLSLYMILPCHCTWYYLVPAHYITLSLHMIIPCPCIWYYPVPAHDNTLSLHMTLPCPCTWYCPIPIPGCAVFLYMAVPCLKVHEIQLMMTLSFLSNIFSRSRD
jgi:hypothetical protein